MDRASRVAVARVGRPHGLRGELRLDPLGGLPAGLGGYRTLLLEQRGVHTPVTLEGERRNGRFLLVKFNGVDSAEQLDLVRRLGLPYAQGNAIVAAQSVDDLERTDASALPSAVAEPGVRGAIVR